MAVGQWTIFGAAKHAIVDGGLDFDNHTFRMVLLTDAYTPNANGHTAWSDLSAAQVAGGGGYVVHGQALTGVTSTDGGSGTTTIDCDDVTWAASTIVAKYAAVIRDGDADGALAAGDIPVAFADLDTGGGSVSTAAGNLTVVIHAAGLITLT
jgi:hypothetical protein